MSKNASLQSADIGKPFYSVSDVAEILGKRPQYVRNLIHEGLLDFYKEGREFRVLPSGLEKYRQSRIVKASEQDNQVIAAFKNRSAVMAKERKPKPQQATGDIENGDNNNTDKIGSSYKNKGKSENLPKGIKFMKSGKHAGKYLAIARPKINDKRTPVRKYFTDLLEAKHWKDRTCEQLKNGEFKGRVKFGDYIEHWKKIYTKGKAPNTILAYDNKLKIIARGLGNYYLDKLKPEHIQIWINSLEGTYSKYSINTFLQMLRNVFAKAVDNDYMQKNPARPIPKLKIDGLCGRRGNIMSERDALEFIKLLPRAVADGVVKEDLARLLEVLILTGMRKGEVLGLKWDRIQGDVLIINASLQYDYKG